MQNSRVPLKIDGAKRLKYDLRRSNTAARDFRTLSCRVQTVVYKKKFNYIEMLVCSNQHHVMLFNLCIISSWTNDPINKGSSSIQAINRMILKVPYVHNIILLVIILHV